MSPKNLRIAFGTTVLNQGLTQGGLDGIGHYSNTLRHRLMNLDGIQLYGFGYFPLGEDRSHQFSTWEVNRFGPQALLSLFSGASFRGFDKLLHQGIDLVHATDHLVPRLKNTPVVATVMDVIPLSNPEWVEYPLKNLKNYAWKKSLGWADRIITISEFSKAQIIEHVNIDDKKIDVVPLGVGADWFENIAENVRHEVNARYSIPHRYLLFVGTLQPRKNIRRLIEAHRLLSDDLRKEYPLLVVGRYGWGDPSLPSLLNDPNDQHVRWLEYLPSQDLKAVVTGASLAIFPSLCEGFGLPVLEAFAAGTPVVASNSTSIPEVAGDAAFLIDPESTEAIKSGIERMLSSRELQTSFIERGRQRATEFTWERTAELTVASYQRLLSNGYDHC